MNSNEILMEVYTDAIPRSLDRFSKYFGETEEENFAYTSIANAIVCNGKINEEDDPVPVTKGTRRPGNRAARRKATRKAKKNRRELATYALDEIMANSGKVKNTGYAAYEKGAKLYKRNKLTAREIAKAVNDGFYYEPEDETDECHWEENPDGTIKPETLRFWFEDDEPEYEPEEEYYRYWDEDLKDHVYVPVETETSKLKKQIATYKDFLGEFNLNTLFERWLADNR